MQPFLRHEVDPNAPEGATPPSRRQSSVGDLLRQTRQGHGTSVEQIADALRIRACYIAAIEEARYADLPGAVYAQGFVRAYANHLGLDADEAVRRFKLETAAFEKPRDLTFPMPLTQRSVPGSPMLLAAFILALCGYGVWYYLSTGDRSRPERVTAVPANLLPAQSTSDAATSGAAPADMAPSTSMPAEAPAGSAPPAAADASSPPTTAPAKAVPDSVAPSAAPGPAMGTTSPAGGPVTSVTAPPSAPAAATVASGAATAGKVYGTDNNVRVVIHVSGDSWVQVRDADHALLLSRTLHAGDVFFVPDKPGITLRTGNASALAITVDGHPAPALGGLIRRDIELDPDRLMAGTAVVD